jgi:hypothetical protein
MKRRFSSIRTAARIIAVPALLFAGYATLSAHNPGRMTGGGSIFEDGTRITHGFELYCQPESANEAGLAEIGPNNLEVNWEGHRFHLETLTKGVCNLGPDPAPPGAPLSIYGGAGFGRFDGEPDFYIVFEIVDAGEPGRSDTLEVSIQGPGMGGPFVVSTTAPRFLDRGNHQAHFLKGGKSFE